MKINIYCRLLFIFGFSFFVSDLTHSIEPPPEDVARVRAAFVRRGVVNPTQDNINAVIHAGRYPMNNFVNASLPQNPNANPQQDNAEADNLN